MTIYFIKNPIVNTVKIGWSQTIPTKLQQLSDVCGIDLVLLGVVDGDKEELERLRVKFAESNYMSDWHNITPVLAEFLRDLREQPKKDQMVRVRWDAYQLLVKHKGTTHIPIVKIVELAIFDYFLSPPDDKPTVYPSYHGGDTDDNK